jgi:RHS repeat-associated protein
MYDALGRTLAQPADDSAVMGGGAAQMTYHVNDMVRSITQGNRTSTYELDVIPTRIGSWNDSATGVTKRNHYSGDSDSPVWVDEGNSVVSRPIAGLAGNAGAWHSVNGVTWSIVNLRGDLVAGVDEAGSGLTYTSEQTEFGQLRNDADVGVRRYGWLGDDQRASDNPAGLVLMGVRLYNPATGRFLQVDPVYGGSCNDYDYGCADPVNNADASGCLVKCKPTKNNKKWRTLREDRKNTWGPWKSVNSKIYSHPVYRWFFNILQGVMWLGQYPVSQKMRNGYHRSYHFRCAQYGSGWYWQNMTVKWKLYQGQVVLKQYFFWIDRYQTVTSSARVYDFEKTYYWDK